jgi:secreted trypsin-like serine protease
MTMPYAHLRLLACLCLAAACGVAASCAPPERQLGRHERPIINGVVDTTHQSVVALVLTAGSTIPGGEFCTGTVIAKRWVLTAGHCWVDADFLPSETSVFFGQTVGTGGQLIGVANAYVHPQYYTASDNTPMYDVAMVELAQAAPVPAMAWQRTSLENLVGQTVTLVGYGVTDASAHTGKGTRRSVDLAVTGQDAMFVTYGPAAGGTCGGDSGGPMLKHGAVETVVSVTSYGDSSCVAMGGNTRTDVFANFIAQYADRPDPDPQPVTVSFAQPQSGSTQQSAFAVRVDAQSSAGVAKVELHLDGVLQGSLAVGPWNFSLQGVADGAHTLRAVASGSDGGTGEASVSFTVGTQPQCSAQSPCATGYDCVNGQCVVHTPADGCSAERPCSTGFHCSNAVCVADAVVPPGTAGASCTRNEECQSALCAEGDTDHGYCTEACASNQDCHNDAACLDTDGTLRCGPPYSALPTGATGGGQEVVGGCRAAPRRAAGAPASLALLLLGLVLRRAARRR